jgi:hypothetical protein
MTPQEFLDAYFRPEHIDLEALSPALRQWLEPWIAEIHDEAESFVLPRRRTGASGFYAMAVNDEEGRRLVEHLQAFVGPAYGRISRQSVDLNPYDETDAAVLAYVGSRCWAVTPLSEDDRGRRQLREALDLLRRVRAQRPPWTRRELRPLGRVLRDFESALFRSDEDASELHLEELERGGLLSLENLRFLHVRRLAALRRWRELRDDERFLTLQDGRRPAGISDVLLETLWHTEVVPSDASDDPSSLVELVRDVLQPQFGPLFSTAAYARSPGALRVATAFAVSLTPPRRDLIEQFLDRGAHDAELVEALTALASLAGPSEATAEQLPSLLTRASDAIDSDQPDLAFDLLRDYDGEEPARRAELLVVAAFALGALDAATTAARAVEELGTVEEEALPTAAVFRRMLEWVQHAGAAALETASRSSVVDWETWLAAVDADPAWTEALAVARRGAGEWDVTSWHSDTDRIDSLAQALVASRGPAATARVRNALGAMVEFIGRLDSLSLPITPLLDAVHQLVVVEDRHSPEDLALLVELTTRLLRDGRTRTEYVQMVDDLLAVWTPIGSYERLDWALQALDVLARYPAPDPQPRVGLLASVAGVIERSRHRIDDVDAAWFSILAAECGVPEIAPYTPQEVQPTDETSPWLWLDGKSLGVHCLMEPAAARAIAIVRTLCALGQAEIDTSVACTDKLRGFCSRHDVIVVVSQHAKHAATECIKSNAPAPTLLVWPEQRTIGTSGIVRALRTALDELQ